MFFKIFSILSTKISVLFCKFAQWKFYQLHQARLDLLFFSIVKNYEKLVAMLKYL